MSVEASLKKLRSSYIDILYVHWWDYGTSVEEVMDSLHTLVIQRKVLYLVSNLIALIPFNPSFIIRLGHLGYSRMGRFQSESVRKRPRKNPVLHLSG